MKRRIAILASALVGFSGVAPAYYHYVHFISGRPIYEKFDLTALTDRTLPYFISDPSSVQISANDSVTALVSQIRSAAKVWNDVDTSDLRVAFGGIVPANTAQSGPSLQVVFDEVPPGYVAMGGPTVKADPNGTFVPIVKSVVVVQQDLRTRSSWSEAFYGTLVHEIGHALGLQHSFTSGVMSTGTTRATTRARPLTADDVAAISVLYPRDKFLTATGSISGRVTVSGNGVNLASVVAIPAAGPAVSALTNPDGTYRIDGLPPRKYSIYVHPLPPALANQSRRGDIVYPVDEKGQPIAPSAPFDTTFFAGDRDVAAGAMVDNINFTVRPRNAVGIHSVETYAFPANTPVKPPYISPGMARPFVVAYGANLTRNNAPVPGLTATVLNGPAMTPGPYAPAPGSYIELDLDPAALNSPTDSPRHLILSANNDTYVLPSAFYHVSRPAPTLLAVAAANDGPMRAAILTGANFVADTRVLFDGVPAQVRSVDDQGRTMTVIPPQAPPGYRAAVLALNSDGQSSLFLQSDAPPTYTYPGDPAAAAPAAVVTPAVLPPGAEGVVQVDAVNATFTDGQLSVGFGTTDVQVRRIVVASPTRAYVQVAVNPSAQPNAQTLTVASGLQVFQQPQALQLQPQPRAFWITAVPGQGPATPGGTAMVMVGASPVTLTSGNTVVLVNDTPVSGVAVQGNLVLFNVPANTPLGTAVVRVVSGNDRSLPALINIDMMPRIALVATASASPARNVRVGELMLIVVTNAVKGASGKISINLGGKDLKPLQVSEEPDRYNVFIQVTDDTATGDSIPLSAVVDGRISEPVLVNVGK